MKSVKILRAKKTSGYNWIWPALFVSFFLWIWLCGQVGAAEAGRVNRLMTKSTIEQNNAASFQMDRITIQKKSLTKVTTNIGDVYVVSAETIIIGTDGQQQSIRQLLVPCEARVTYSKEKGIRKAQQIVVKQVGRNASWQWTSDHAE